MANEEKVLNKLIDGVSDTRFQDSIFAMALNNQPPKEQRRVMKLFLTAVKFWAVDYKYSNYQLKDEDTIQTAEMINSLVLDENSPKNILDRKPPTSVEWSNDPNN